MSIQHLESLKQDADPVSSSNSLPDSLLSIVPRTSCPLPDALYLRNAASRNSLRACPIQCISQTATPPSLNHIPPRKRNAPYSKLPKTYPASFLCEPFPITASEAAKSTRSQLKTHRKRTAVLIAPCFAKHAGSPDRFVPRRRSENGLLKSFRASKSLEKLSSAERNLRNHAANDNPFASRRTTATQRRIRNEAQRRPAPSMPGVSSRRGPLRAWAASSSGNRNSTSSTRAQLGPVPAIQDGRGRLIRSGTNAPLFYANFFPKEPPEYIRDRFEHRLAAALDIDRSARILRVALPEVECNISDAKPSEVPTERWWDNIRWAQDQKGSITILDAPQLRDDFYCSILAFCAITRTLAVGLGNRVYLWCEDQGVIPLQRSIDEERDCYIGSICFSHGTGGRSILAVGRSNGTLSLCALNEDDDKFVCGQPNGITCVSFKPVPAFQRSVVTGVPTLTEELLVGDDKGHVFYYSIQWETNTTAPESSGSMQLLAKIEIHSEQICGIEWSPDGKLFATGSNDNLCLLFDTADIFDSAIQRETRLSLRTMHPQLGSNLHRVPSDPRAASLLRELHRQSASEMEWDAVEPEETSTSTFTPRPRVTHTISGMKIVTAGCETQRWVHAAAIKAIAFCPWQRGLIAVGGGSNDRAIHFYHIWSGACLATINVLAQVTSLIWSKTRREIVATLGYCQPDHPYRIAVYTWPDCEQIVAIPWQSETRALYAIPYPSGPNDTKVQRSAEGERWWSRTAEEGSIVVASSDESVKFYEAWSEKARSARLGPGGLGWSDILEGLEGAEEDGGTIR